jgi:Domain of unknown function DUF29
MPDDLYWDDTLLWSERQSALLRRLAAGERVNDVDWEHVIEEIEDVGKTELRACTSLLRQAIRHLLKLHLWPDSDAAAHWRGEAAVFRADARHAFSPSMRQLIDLPEIYAESIETIGEADTPDLLARVPRECPFALDELLGVRQNLDALLAKLRPSAG